MTDRHSTGPEGREAEPPEAGPLDELASAILDGAATDAELARAAESEIAQRVARFSALAEQVRAVPDGPAERKEAAIAAALAAFGGAAPADELAARRSRRPAWADPARLRILGAAAAAVVAIAVGAAVLDSSPGDDETTAADAVDDRASEEAATAESSLDAETPAADSAAGEDGSASAGGGAAEPAPAPVDLGEFDTAEQLLDEALTRPTVASQDAGFGTESSAVAARCPDPTGGATRIDTAELDRREVLVYVRDAAVADAEPVIVVVDAATCEVLARRGP